jgi:hypothetical protein
MKRTQRKKELTQAPAFSGMTAPEGNMNLQILASLQFKVRQAQSRMG